MDHLLLMLKAAQYKRELGDALAKSATLIPHLYDAGLDTDTASDINAALAVAYEAACALERELLDAW